MTEIEQEVIRRIQVTGRGSYIVSLPKRWIESFKLNKGDSMFISQKNNNSLILTPRKLSKVSDKKEIIASISLEDDLDSIIRRIISLYLVGYNTIQLKSKNRRMSLDQRDYIKNCLRTKLIGSEIITESQDTMTIQVLLSYSELTVDNALRRMMAIANAMHDDVMDALKNFDKGLAGEIIKMDDEVDRFNFFIIRQLKLAVKTQPLIEDIGLKDPRDILGYRLITKSIERIADHATNIARNIKLMDQKIDPDIYSRLKEMSTYASLILKDVEKSFFSLNYDLAENVIKKAKETSPMEKEAIITLLKGKLSPNDLSRLRVIIESIRRIAEYGSDIAEIVLNLTVTKTVKTI